MTFYEGININFPQNNLLHKEKGANKFISESSKLFNISIGKEELGIFKISYPIFYIIYSKLYSLWLITD
jgi:hypothetical protein